MKKSKFLAAAFAATMFATAACGLVACDKDAGGLGEQQTPTPTGKTITVTFNAGTGATLKGSSDTSKKVTVGTDGKIKASSVPEADKTNNTFEGWALIPNAGKDAVINFTSKVFTKDTPVYAVFTPTGGGGGGDENEGVFTITLDANVDGTCSTPSLTTTNGKLTSLPDAVGNTGYLFNGWFDAPENGNRVTLATSFTKNTVIYAQYSSTTVVVEGKNYAMVGTKKYELTETSLPGAEEAYIVTVDLSAGATISFYVDGELLEVWAGYTWNGMVNPRKKVSEFTAAREGTFEFKLGYYPADEEGNDATWSVDGDDGQVTEVDAKPIGSSGVWLVGEGISGGGWGNGIELIKEGSVWTATVTVSSDGWLKIRNGGSSDGTGTNALANEGECAVYDGTNFLVKTDGTYKFTWDGSKLTVKPA